MLLLSGEVLMASPRIFSSFFPPSLDTLTLRWPLHQTNFTRFDLPCCGSLPRRSDDALSESTRQNFFSSNLGVVSFIFGCVLVLLWCYDRWGKKKGSFLVCSLPKPERNHIGWMRFSSLITRKKTLSTVPSPFSASYIHPLSFISDKSKEEEEERKASFCRNPGWWVDGVSGPRYLALTTGQRTSNCFRSIHFVSLLYPRAKKEKK